MPRVSRSLEVPVAIESVWDFVSRPGNLAKWWPRVIRVEGVVGQAGTTGLSWTSLLEADSGRRVRLDFQATKADPPNAFGWTQELASTQFEKHLKRQDYMILLDDRAGGTAIELVAETDLKGSAKLASLTLRKSQGRVLDRALSDLCQTLLPGLEDGGPPES